MEKNKTMIAMEEGYGLADLISMSDEEIDGSRPIPYVDPVKPWKKMHFRNVEVKEMQKVIFKDGKLVYEKPALDTIRSYVKHQLTEQVWEEEQRFENPHIHYVDLTTKLYNIKKSMLEQFDSLEGEG